MHRTFTGWYVPVLFQRFYVCQKGRGDLHCLSYLKLKLTLKVLVILKISGCASCRNVGVLSIPASTFPGPVRDSVLEISGKIQWYRVWNIETRRMPQQIWVSVWTLSVIEMYKNLSCIYSNKYLLIFSSTVNNFL